MSSSFSSTVTLFIFSFFSPMLQPSSPVRCPTTKSMTTPPLKTRLTQRCDAKRSGIKKRSLASSFTASNGFETLLLAAEHANETIKYEDETMSDDQKKIRTFRKVHCQSADEAKELTSTHDDAVGFCVDKIKGTYVVYFRIIVDSPNGSPNEVDIEWNTIKAWYRKIGRFVLVHVKGCPRVINVRGSIRDMFSLPHNMVVKHYVQTCSQCDMKVCWNCQHPKWNAKCLTGLDYYLLTNR